jgi:hypothetical protein
LNALLLCLAAMATTADAAVLDVRSEPPGAMVFLDGQPIGTTPVRLTAAPGIRQIAINKAGYRRVVLDHLAEAGASRQFLIRLGKAPRVALGAGLASAGAALTAGGIAALVLAGGGGATEAERVLSAPSPGSRLLGGVLTGAGVLLGLASLWPLLSGTPSQVQELPVQPVAVRSGAGIVAGFRF